MSNLGILGGSATCKCLKLTEILGHKCCVVWVIQAKWASWIPHRAKCNFVWLPEKTPNTQAWVWEVTCPAAADYTDCRKKWNRTLTRSIFNLYTEIILSGRIRLLAFDCDHFREMWRNILCPDLVFTVECNFGKIDRVKQYTCHVHSTYLKSLDLCCPAVCPTTSLWRKILLSEKILS